MELNKEEISIFDSVLRTLIYNTIDDLKHKLLNVKDQLSGEKYNLLMFGNTDLYNEDCDLENKNKYLEIKELDNRWCLQSILYYHLNRIKRFHKMNITKY